MKRFECKDFYPSCNWSYESNDENEIVDKAGEHGHQAHGIKEMTQDLKDKVKSKIREIKAA